MQIVDAHAHVFELCQRGVSTGERLIEYMDSNSVDKAILLGNPYYGFFNDLTRKCCLDYPERFIGVALVDVLEGEKAARELEALYREGILFGMAIESASTFAKAPEVRMTDRLLAPVWECIGTYKQPVFLHMFRDEDLCDLDELSGRYPDSLFICCHLGEDACHGSAAKAQNFDYLLDIAKRRENIMMDTSSLPDYYPQQYPFTVSCRVIEGVWKKLGAERLLWGSDYPGTLTFAPYGQLIDTVRKDCAAIPEHDLELIMGQNAQRAFWNKK